MAGLWLTLALAVGEAWGCSTPVFRYALERWEPSPYGLVIFHRGPLDANQQAWVKALRQTGLEGNGHANVATATVDLDTDTNATTRALWVAQTNAVLPWMVLRYPDSEPGDPAAWTAPFNGVNVRDLLDSPARREIARRIAAGDSAVWVLVEGGDTRADNEMAGLLENELKKAAATLEIPTEAPGDNETNAVQLKFNCSLLRLSRANAAERVLLANMLSLDEELAAAKTPVAVPIFGRGRALCALPSRQIKPEVIAEAISFLRGACSCEVKELNPGIDLLLAADWNAAVEGKRLSDTPPPALVGLGALAEPAKTNSPLPVVAAGTPAPPPAPLRRNLLYFGLGLAVAVGAVSVLISRRRRLD